MVGQFEVPSLGVEGFGPRMVSRKELENILGKVRRGATAGMCRIEPRVSLR